MSYLQKENWECLVLKLAKDLMGNNTQKTVELFKKNPTRAFDKALSNVEVIDDFSFYPLRDIFINEGGQTSQLIGLDVTASGLQIMGLITRCTKALEMTHVFEQNLEDLTNKTLDIYHTVQKRVAGKYPIVQEMDRKFYKGIIMRMSYGEGVYSRKKALNDYFRMQKNEEFKENKNKNTLLLDIAKAYDEAIYKEFPEFKIFTNQVNKVVEIRTRLNLGINFNVSDIFKTNQYYNIDKATTYSFRTLEGRRKRIKMYIPDKITSDYKRYEAKPNTRKIKRATLPNFIHHVDSLLAHSVIKEFRKELKPIFTVHDAFYVRLTDMTFLKEVYFNALKQLHDQDPWSKFLETNKIKLEDLRNNHWTAEEKTLAEDLNDTISNWMIPRKSTDFKRPKSSRILS